ncbi:hypothetical protein [Merismopedia glauca]|nr:hypothetical protein [Merismopedia glauca]
MRSTPTGWLYRQVGYRQRLRSTLLVTRYSLLPHQQVKNSN